ncbi:MAG: response regulator [Gammaproteobacteria bacterium]
MFSLLIVEDDQGIQEMLQSFLVNKGYEVATVENGRSALNFLADNNPNLVLLDWMLPDLSGPELLRKMRKNSVQRSIPVIMLTARAEEENKIEGLDAGADDYLTKPVSLKEMHARIRALIRRSQGLDEKNLLTAGALTLNPANHELSIYDAPVKIASTEFSLLHYLMRSPDRLLSRPQILDQVWGQTAEIEERTVDVHILRLRKLLRKHGVEEMIETVRGAGYRFTGVSDG